MKAATLKGGGGLSCGICVVRDFFVVRNQNHFGPIEPQHIGYHQEAFVVARTINKSYEASM
jgi:hypothetical protein